MELRQRDYRCVQEFLAGDQEAWDTLYAQAYGVVLSCAAREDYDHILSISDYHDATMEAFTICMQKLEQYRDISRFATWVSGHVRNLIRNRRRRQLTRMRHRDELIRDFAETMWRCDPLTVVIRKEQYQSLYRGFCELEALEQMILWEEIVCETSLRKVAQKLSIPTKEIKRRHEIAIRELKQRFIYHYYCLPAALR